MKTFLPVFILSMGLLARFMDSTTLIDEIVIESSVEIIDKEENSASNNEEQNKKYMKDLAQRNADNIILVVNDDTLTVTLRNLPDSREIIASVADAISINNSITKVIFQRGFGTDNAGGWGRSLAEGSISSIHFINSNYIPVQLYSGSTGLLEVTDDGSIRSISSRAIRDSFNTSTGLSDIRKIELNGLESISQWNLEGFNGKNLNFPKLKNLGQSRSSTSILNMPNIEMIDFSSLESLTGWNTFNNMPNVKEIDLSNLKTLDLTGTFFDLKNQFPVYVNIGMLEYLPDNSGSTKDNALAPIYIFVGKGFASNLENSSSNILAYSGLNRDLESKLVSLGSTFSLNSFGENFHTFGDDISINWYVNGDLSEYKGSKIEIDSSSIGLGEFKFKPVVTFNGIEDTSFFQDINLTVTIYAEDHLNADAVGQTIDLGGSFNDGQVQNFVTNVTLNDNSLLEDEYEVLLITEPDTSVAGKTVQAVVKVSHKETGQKIALEVPVKVNWGNAIRFNGHDNISGGVYNWHPDQKLITSKLGDRIDPSGPVHMGFNETYYSFSLHKLGDDQENFIDDIADTYKYEVNGQSSRLSAVEGFGNGTGMISANIGDIIEVYHAEPAYRLRQYISPSSEDQRVSTSNEKAYFELTSSGFNQLSFDRAIPIDTTLKADTTKEEFDENIGNYLDISNTKNVTIVGFEKYPNTKSKGKDNGVIRIKEKLNSGKIIVYDYEIQFTIESGNLEISQVKNGNFNFGEIKKSSRSQNVLANGSEAPSITINDYSSATQWGLYVSATPFMSEENKKLNGAFITLKNLKVKETVHTWLGIPSRDIELNEVPQMIGTMSNPNGIYGEENGQSVIQIGEVENGKLTGVDLTLLGNTVMDSSEYKAKITWELVGDPTNEFSH